MGAYLEGRTLAPPRAGGYSAAIIGAVLVAGGMWATVAQAQSPCIDVNKPIAFEEQRLGNKLRAENPRPFAVDILGSSGFTKFEGEFIAKLGGTGDGQSAPCGAATPADYDAAFAMVGAEGNRLWRAIVDRVQGRKVSQSDDPNIWPTLPRGDDRPLYWARVTMARALNRWNPPWPLSDEQRTALQLQLEKGSRGILDMKFPPGPKYKRIVLSGFDVFTLPAPGTNGTGMRNANPSAAIVLTMDGARAVQPDGTILVTEAYILPVSYGPFMLGMLEDTLGPFYADMGPDRIIASISISQAGGSVFNLEMWNSRFH